MVYLSSLELGSHCLLWLLSYLNMLCQLEVAQQSQRAMAAQLMTAQVPPLMHAEQVLAADTLLQLQLHCNFAILQCATRASVMLTQACLLRQQPRAFSCMHNCTTSTQ